jgi:hypothetical protein
MTERVLIYGSRDWWDSNAIRNLIFSLSADDVVIHGGARGADALADRWAKACGQRVEVFRAEWGKYGKGAGPRRNQQMIDQGHPTQAYGFRLAGASPGTDDMTRRLVVAGIPHEIVSPASTDARRAPESGWGALGVTYTVSGAPDASVDDQQADWSKVEMCPTCRCCSIGRMGTCVGGCEPNGDRREHDRPARAERDAAGDAEGQD